jgi:hypothetical protein
MRICLTKGLNTLEKRFVKESHCQVPLTHVVLGRGGDKPHLSSWGEGPRWKPISLDLSSSKCNLITDNLVLLSL